MCACVRVLRETEMYVCGYTHTFVSIRVCCVGISSITGDRWVTRGRSYVIHITESCYANESVTSHVCMGHVKHEWVMSRMRMSPVTYLEGLYHTHEWRDTYARVMSHIWMIHAIHMNESWVISHKWVMWHMWMIHVTHTKDPCHMNESCHTYELVVLPCHTNESCATNEFVMSHI